MIIRIITQALAHVELAIGIIMHNEVIYEQIH